MVEFDYLASDAFGDSLRRHGVVLARFDGARLHDVRAIFTSRPAKSHTQHFGGRMALLADGTLVVGMGDGNLERTDAQRLSTHLGKIVRIGRARRSTKSPPSPGRRRC